MTAPAGDAPTPPPLVEVRGISRDYPGVRALDGVDLEIRAGEVLAVVGENGAGKSTLMRILAGVESPSRGTVLVDGEPVRMTRVHDAIDRGIALIHQELNLADNLSVGANIWLGREPRRFGFIRGAELERRARDVLATVGLNVDPAMPLADLSIARRQLVEIAKALSYRARLIIMDEPTSSLSLTESARLFEVVDDLRRRGVAVAYISHRLGEVMRLADRVVVLRDGRRVGELERRDLSRRTMVRLMVGRDLEEPVRRPPPARSRARLEVRGLRTRAHPEHAIDLDVAPGEIVALAGLVGAGRTELLETLFGVVPAAGGRIAVDGRSMPASHHPRIAVRLGLGLVPEDRRRHGLIVDMTVRSNLVLPALARFAWRGIRRPRAEAAASAARMRDLAIRAPRDGIPARVLSGGNQQKVVVGRWLETRPRVLLLDEPTRGIDVGAKGEIHDLMRRLAEAGLAVLFASSEMDEVLALADRIVVMHEGAISGELQAAGATEEAVMRLATGGDGGA